MTAAPAGGSAPRRGPGRPPSDNPRSEVVRYRLTTDELAALTAAADSAGLSVTEYARTAALNAAKEQQHG